MDEAEKRIAQSPFDNGGGKAVADAGSPSAKGNNRFQADTQALQELDTALTKINTNINKLKNDLPKVITLTEQWAAKMRMVSQTMTGMGGGSQGTGGYIKPAGQLTNDTLNGGGGGFGGFHFGDINVNRSQNVTMMGGGGGGRGTGGGGGAGSTTAGIVDGITKALGPLMSALNNRISENASYSMSANRMDMLYQQTTGMSRGSVYATQRQPLQQYKLGPGGINSIMALQASTGINALQQGKSVEALRTASGFAYSTDQINQMTRGMASAESANRMFMTMGTGMYGIGGQQKSSMGVIKDVVKRMGLTTEASLKGALAPGSMTRERLRQSGLPEDMQDLVLQYAQENVSYKKKGGAGMYDPSNKAMRKTMGVEGAYANQAEETERVKGAREENMYNRQADNYAAMEKQMQSLTRTMQKLDDAMSGLVGAKIRNRGIGSLIKGALPAIGTGIGAALGAASFTPFGVAAGAMVGSALGGMAGTALGDATGERESNAQKLNAKSTTASTPNITKSQGALAKLHPKMREKVQKMMKENPKLYIGGGVRSSAEQKAMFMDRYKPTTEKTDVFWKGQYWTRTKGAAAAPPGMSMHEIGLAVDFAPSTQFEWVKENAHRFGLRSFFDVNNEPWHVQPSELPASRMQYEKSGAPWGHNGNVAEPTDTKAILGNLGNLEHQSVSGMGGQGVSSKSVNMKIQDYSGMSMNDTINAMGAVGGLSGSGADSSSGKSASGGYENSVKGSTNPVSPGSNSSGSRSLSGSQVASILYKAGFRGKRLVEAVAIAHRESRFNPKSHNPKPPDNSYGLMQINMIGKNGPARRGYYNLKKNEDLFDPDTNARVAWKLTGHGNNWDHWKINGNALADTNLPAASKYVKQAGYETKGDPVKGMNMNSGSYNNNKAMATQAPTPTQAQPISIQSDGGTSYNVTIAPTIHMHGSNNTAMDAQKLSREITMHVERQMRLTSQRGR